MNKKFLFALVAFVVVAIGAFKFIDYRNRMVTLSMAPEELFGWETQVKFAKAHRGELRLKDARIVKPIATIEDIAEAVEMMAGDDAYTVLYDREGEEFEVLTIGQKRERLADEGFEYENIIKLLKIFIGDLSGLPFNSVNIVEFEWRYKGKTYISYGVEGKDVGGILYESLGYYVTIDHKCDKSYRISEKMNDKLEVVVLRESNSIDISTQSILGLITSRATIYCYSEFRDGVHYESVIDMQRSTSSGYMLNIKTQVNDYDGEGADLYGSDFQRFSWAWLLTTDDFPKEISLEGEYDHCRVHRHVEGHGSTSQMTSSF